MPTLEFEMTVAAPLQVVWTFYENVRESLPALCPPKDQVRVESADVPVRAGSRVIFHVRGPFGRPVRWVGLIVEHVPPHPVVFGEEARFVDVQESGPFKSWRHEHDFERVNEKTTRVLDRITYRVGLGPAGFVADHLIVRPRIRGMFRHRHAALRRLLEATAAR
jgi:ligand-binding SRPBCC domain-containing protein